jgi:hypothetical protein
MNPRGIRGTNTIKLRMALTEITFFLPNRSINMPVIIWLAIITAANTEYNYLLLRLSGLQRISY